jgi:beta-lactamase regulating signal transducer with metallopeptidase domain
MTGSAVAAGILALFAGYALRTTVVLTLALLAAAAAKRRPAAFRHFILSFTLIGLLLLPLLSLVPVGWRSPLLPAWMAASGPGVEDAWAIEKSDRATEVSSASGVETDPAGNGRQPMAAPSPLNAEPGVLEIRSERAPSLPSSAASDAQPDRVSTGSPARGSQPHQRILNFLVAGLWSTGLVVLFLRFIVGLAGAVRLTAEGSDLDDPVWRVLLERFLSLVSLRRRVRLKSHPEILVPLTWGWRRPIVLLPAGADGWSDEERSSALFHELSHVKRADFLVMLLVRTSLALFWWNPLCWVVYQKLLREQEIACDELVLHTGIRPSTYAATLLAFRRSAGFRWNPSAALLGMLGRSSFQERLAAILRQEVTFMEVKMKTKITLALTLALAVALIGTARPAAGRETPEFTTTIVESAMPAPGSFDVVAPAVDTQQASTEKAAVAEQEKKKAEKEKAEKEKVTAEKRIVVTPKEGGKAPLEIVITEGDQVKTLTLDKPFTIIKSKDGHSLILSSDGKEIQVLEGEPLRLEIKGGDIEVLKAGEVLKVGEALEVGEGGVYKIVKEGGERGVKIVVRTREKGEPEIGWTLKEGDKETGWVAKELPGKPGARTWVSKDGTTFVFSRRPGAGTWFSKDGKAFAFSTFKNEEMLERVHALQEQVQAIIAKKMDITALEESLRKLEAELKAKEEKLKEFEVKLDKAPGEVTFVKEIHTDKSEGKATVWVAEKDKIEEAHEGRAYVKVENKDKGGLTLVWGQKGLSRETYDRALAKLKKDLPEGYKLLESNFDEKAAEMTFKIAPPEGKERDPKLTRKLIDGLREEIKTKK